VICRVTSGGIRRPKVFRATTYGINRVTAELGTPEPHPPVSVIGVDYLFEPDVLVEVEAYALLE